MSQSPSLSQLQQPDAFLRRHLGPDAAEQRAMLDVLGVGSRDELIEQTVPPAIRLNGPLQLPAALDEQAALAKLRTEQRIALLHYAPIVGTVQGEPPEIFPFLGTSRLEDALLHYPVNVVLHGHAHRGCPEGKMVNQVPVYNVAKPLLQRRYPDRPPFRVIEIATTSAGAENPENAEV